MTSISFLQCILHAQGLNSIISSKHLGRNTVAESSANITNDNQLCMNSIYHGHSIRWNLQCDTLSMHQASE